MCQHDNDPVQKARPKKAWFAKMEWKNSNLNPTQHLWDALERRHAGRKTNALLVEWVQPPTATFQNLAESFPRRVDIIITEKEGTPPCQCP